MYSLSRIYMFVEVARAGSFVGAAQHLGVTSSAISKQIQNLEQDLQVTLLNRTTRKVSLTEEGQLFFDRARRALDDIQEAKEELNELKATPKGTLRVTLPLSLGLQYLKKPIADFSRQFPDVIMDVQFEDRQIDLIEAGFDLALRIGSLKDSSLIARKLMDIPIHIVGSPDYLRNAPPINTPDDLRHHNVFEYTRDNAGGAHEWQFQSPDGTRGTVPLQSRFHCDSVEMMKEAALNGVGLFISPLIFIRPEQAAGQLTTVLDDYRTMPDRALYAVFPPHRFGARRLRLFVEHIESYCKAHLR